jgi:hypothetical protein
MLYKFDRKPPLLFLSPGIGGNASNAISENVQFEIYGREEDVELAVQPLSVLALSGNLIEEKNLDEHKSFILERHTIGASPPLLEEKIEESLLEVDGSFCSYPPPSPAIETPIELQGVHGARAESELRQLEIAIFVENPFKLRAHPDLDLLSGNVECLGAAKGNESPRQEEEERPSFSQDFAPQSVSEVVSNTDPLTFLSPMETDKENSSNIVAPKNNSQPQSFIYPSPKVMTLTQLPFDTDGGPFVDTQDEDVVKLKQIAVYSNNSLVERMESPRKMDDSYEIIEDSLNQIEHADIESDILQINNIEHHEILNDKLGEKNLPGMKRLHYESSSSVLDNSLDEDYEPTQRSCDKELSYIPTSNKSKNMHLKKKFKGILSSELGNPNPIRRKKKVHFKPDIPKIFKGIDFIISVTAGSVGDRWFERKNDLSTKVKELGGTVIGCPLASKHYQNGKKMKKLGREIFLITSAPSRTKKFLLALALGIPIISSSWIRDCIEQKNILDHNGYRLSNGDSIILGQPCAAMPSNTKLFLDKKIYGKENDLKE